MKAFISYSTSLDEIIALRLQTMAAVYGITSYVPPATTRQQNLPLSPEVRQQLQESDVVLAIITHNPAASALSEMNWSLTERKLLIPIVSPGVPPEYYAGLQPVFVVNPADPSQAEHLIVKHLTEKQQAQTTNKALIALATLSVALLVLGAVSSD